MREENEMYQAAEAISATLAAPLDESGLIRAAQNGDQDAFERLVREYDQSVLRIAVNILRSPDEARDVYQEAFLKVYRNLNSFRFDCSFHTWLYRIVTNICLDHLTPCKVQAKKSPPAVETPDDDNGPDNARCEGRRRPFRSRAPDVESRTLRWHLAGAGWPDPHAGAIRCLSLRHYEGLRLRAIGDMIGTTEEAAKSYRCSARHPQKMRMSLETFV